MPAIKPPRVSSRKRAPVRHHEELPRKRRNINMLADLPKENNKFDNEPNSCESIFKPKAKPMLEALIRSVAAKKGAQFVNDVYHIEVYNFDELHQHINQIINKENPTIIKASRLKAFQSWFEIPGCRNLESFFMTIKTNKKRAYTRTCKILQLELI